MNEPIYSPGLEGIVAGETAISTIAGGLQYRGYSIEDLAAHATWEEVLYLVLHSELPTTSQLARLHDRLTEAAHVPTALINMLRKIPLEAPFMDLMRTGASLLAHWDPDIRDNSTPANLRKAERLAAQLPVVMAARYRLLRGLEPVNPDPKLPIAANILWMLFRRQPTPREIKAMDVSLILYAEHEYNASTFAARVICSTLSDLHSSIVGAIGALKGPLHGGANERVLEVLQQVGSADKAEAWVREALARKERIMGFGHRVYKTGDPRAAYLKTLCQSLAEESGHQDMESMADTIERFIREEKKLPPNLDWPSARLYHYLGLEMELFTPLFAVSRVAGWSAHVAEQLSNNRLIRPRANYTGPQLRVWKPIEQREPAPEAKAG
jgi:2-methylcitrate synthase/citrate synthase II